METTPPPSTPQPPKESVTRRFKVAWRVLLISNLALGAYMFARARKKETSKEESKAAAMAPPPPPPPETATTPPPEEPIILEPPKAREPIPEDQQRELFKWILEEKRKIKPKDREEKKRLDEEKAILKQFIRAKSIPRI